MRKPLLCVCRFALVLGLALVISLAVAHSDMEHIEHRFGPAPFQTRGNLLPATLAVEGAFR